jgi:hypothetical protein
MREILLLPQPLLPSARLLHTVRWVAQRDHLTVDVWNEEQAFHAAYTAPETLQGVLVHVPHGLFPAGSQLQEQLRLAGVRWSSLPPLPHRTTVDGLVVEAWETLLPPGALSQWLAQGTPAPWQPPRRDPQWCRIPTIPAGEVPRWH